jgi:citrate lyase subunit beta/citryl-CoA lyase
MRLRSLLFVPGDRPDRMEKALGLGADALILDLEDAVAPSAKPEARRQVAAFVAAHPTAHLWVRINPIDGTRRNGTWTQSSLLIPRASSFPRLRAAAPSTNSFGA